MLKKIIRFFSRKKPMSVKEFRDFHYKHFSGRVCNICGEEYQGLAQDCKCTNYGE